MFGLEKGGRHDNIRRLCRASAGLCLIQLPERSSTRLEFARSGACWSAASSGRVAAPGGPAGRDGRFLSSGWKDGGTLKASRGCRWMSRVRRCCAASDAWAACGFRWRIRSRLQLLAPGEEWPDEDLADDSADAIEAEKELAVLSLVEDEVLLALPIAPDARKMRPAFGGRGRKWIIAVRGAGRFEEVLKQGVAKWPYNRTRSPRPSAACTVRMIS
jgi:hypothetical protein